MDNQRDHCGEDGALRLRDNIERFWAERGHNVRVWVSKEGFSPSMRSARFDLRSNLVNGLPSNR
jgi:hypothetical protein